MKNHFNRLNICNCSLSPTVYLTSTIITYILNGHDFSKYNYNNNNNLSYATDHINQNNVGSTIKCKYCKKTLKHKSGLYRHHNICIYKNKYSVKENISGNNITNNIINNTTNINITTNNTTNIINNFNMGNSMNGEIKELVDFNKTDYDEVTKLCIDKLLNDSIYKKSNIFINFLKYAHFNPDIPKNNNICILTEDDDKNYIGTYKNNSYTKHTIERGITIIERLISQYLKSELCNFNKCPEIKYKDYYQKIKKHFEKMDEGEDDGSYEKNTYEIDIAMEMLLSIAFNKNPNFSMIEIQKSTTNTTTIENNENNENNIIN
jgi:hypothetical protein